MSATQRRAPRCPEGYVSRSIRTDPAVHEAIKKIADKEKKQGGAGQVYLELAIAHIKKKTGETFQDGFKAFYATKTQRT